MAFLIHTVEGGHIPAWEYHPAGEITPGIGKAMTMSSGALAVAGGTTRPQYICMTERDAAVTSGTMIPVVRVTEDIIFECEAAVSMAAIKAGDKVTLSADGMSVTATTTGGIAEIVEICGTGAVGDGVRVRFS